MFAAMIQILQMQRHLIVKSRSISQDGWHAISVWWERGDILLFPPFFYGTRAYSSNVLYLASRGYQRYAVCLGILTYVVKITYQMVGFICCSLHCCSMRDCQMLWWTRCVSKLNSRLVLHWQWHWSVVTIIPTLGSGLCALQLATIIVACTEASVACSAVALQLNDSCITRLHY